MKIRFEFARSALVCAATLAASACASSDIEKLEGSAGEPQWAANGWLSPDPSGEPEIIGLYVSRSACDAAVEEWMAQQVVGNPVHGECLPIDKH